MTPKDSPSRAPDRADESAPPTRPDPPAATDAPPTSPPVPGQERAQFGLSVPGYEILGELGRGGMGVVYKAIDRKREHVVALKTLQHVNAAALYRFKQEFRILADVAHPNLVTLYELGSDGETWFFTMELLDGVDLMTHVRGTEGRGPGLSPAQLSRLRESLRQLAQGISALHAAGILHRDLKPANVLVTPQGRVVLLDFGLAAELDRQLVHHSAEQHVVGTVAYMAPEQGAALPVSFPADWYALGTILYEALTGQLPFRGSVIEILRARDQREPPAPREAWPDVPQDLDELCVEALRRDPERRPPGDDVLRRLSAGAVAPARRASALIGRETHLRELAHAFEAAKAGGTVAVRVHGPSGSGKSALVRCFLDDLLERGEAVVLAGRCYEQESMPFKALDSLVDALGQHLGRLSALEVQALLPRDVVPLQRVFPVLQRFEVGRAARSVEQADPQEIRRRAFAGLRELLARLGDRRPLVLAIDDLQWGDVDSAVMLSDLLLPPDPPVLLLIGAHRSEDVQNSPFLKAYAQLRPEGIDRRELAIEPLSAEQSAALARQLIGDDAALRRHAATLAREAGGNPFFVQELVQYLSDGDSLPTVWLTLDEMVWQRVRKLPDDARRLVEVVAVSGHPIGRTDACEAAGLPRSERSALSLLRTARLIRSTGTAESDDVECYHDRIRETVAGRLPQAESQMHHRRLAETLEKSASVASETLAAHWLGAGESRLAATKYAVAAEQASQALAFDRAAELYRLALDLGDEQGAERRKLLRALGDSLANAGRGAEAARAYLAAGEGAADEAELKRLAAGNLLKSGHIDNGLKLLDEVLRALGTGLPRSPRSALLSLLWSRLKLWLRGLDFQSRASQDVSPEVLTRIDLYWSIVTGLSGVDPIRGLDFQTRCLILALRAGEPRRITRSLAMEAVSSATGGSYTRERTAMLLLATEKVASQVNDAYASGMIEFSRGVATFLLGNWQQARELFKTAELIFRERCTGANWEINTMQAFDLWAVCFTGDFSDWGPLWPAKLKDALVRGDLYALSNLSCGLTLAQLAADAPEDARRHLEGLMSQWTHSGFHVQHHNALIAHLYIELYNGKGLASWQRVSEKWSGYGSSLLLRVQQIRINAHFMRSCAALAASAETGDVDLYLRVVGADVRVLTKEKSDWAAALASLLAAQVAVRRGNSQGAVSQLRDAAARLDAVDMRIYAASARRALGVLLGGDEGRRLVADADAWMTSQQIRNPARMAAVFTPGFG